MMNINKSTLANNSNAASGNTYFLSNSAAAILPSQQQQQMKVMNPTNATTTSTNTSTTNSQLQHSNMNPHLMNPNQYGPSFATTANNPQPSSTPQLPFNSQHTLFSNNPNTNNSLINQGVSVGQSGGGISGNVVDHQLLHHHEDPNIQTTSNSGFDFLSMNPFTTPSDPFLNTNQSSNLVNQTTLASGIVGSSLGGGGAGAPQTFNRERRLSSIFDIENSRDSDSAIGLFGSNNVFNANKDDSCFSFGDQTFHSDKKNDIEQYDHSLFSFMENRRFSISKENQKSDFPLPPLSSPLLGNIPNTTNTTTNTDNDFKFPNRDLMDESSKFSFISNSGKNASPSLPKQVSSTNLLVNTPSSAIPSSATNASTASQPMRNISFNEMYNNQFNYDALNGNNQTTMQKLLNMQQLILNNQERIQQTNFLDNNGNMKQQDQLVWNSIFNAQRNERMLNENLFNQQLFNQNNFMNKDNILMDKHLSLNTIALNQHQMSAQNPLLNESGIGFMNQNFQFGNEKSSNIQQNQQSSSSNSQKTLTPNIHSNSSKSTSNNRKKRKHQETSQEKKKKIKSQGHSSESQLSNQEIILASSSNFDEEQLKCTNSKEFAQQHVDESSRLDNQMHDNDSEEDSEDSNQKKFCFRNLIVEKSSKKMKFVNSDIKEEGVNQGAWSEREHQAFLKGLKDLGYGKWREIADRYVKTRTRIQVASHSQKYHQRLERHARKKKKLLKNQQPATSEPEPNDIVLQHDTIHSDD